MFKTFSACRSKLKNGAKNSFQQIPQSEQTAGRKL
jgi:hypothetical protein